MRRTRDCQAPPRALSPWILLATALCLCLSAAAVDRSRFKTCSQSGFCQRNREWAQSEGVSPYVVEEGSLVRTQGRFSCDLLNRENGVRFHLVMSKYPQGVRVKLTEKAPISPRYEVPGVLSHSLRRVDIEDVDGRIFGLVELQMSPFSLKFYNENGELEVEANERHLFNIEHLREKPTEELQEEDGGADDDEHLIGDRAAASGSGALGLKKIGDHMAWEEKFQNMADKKPKGPSSISMDFTFPGASFVYGIPEHASTLALKSTTSTDPYRLYNLDVFEYELDETMSLYGAVPLMISMRNGKSTAIFWLNASETWIDVDNSHPGGVATHWFSESGAMDFFVLTGPTSKDILGKYMQLTGFPSMPPLFSIAYHQCRWNYRDQADVLEVDRQMDHFDIPYDVIWLDIEHTDSKKYFTWDKKKFPEPKKMLEAIGSKGRRMVNIVDPHIKLERGYYIHDEADSKQNFWVKKADGSDYSGWCWPGESRYLDFSSAEVREWWGDQFALDSYEGSAANLFIWNDMNEPSVFNGPEVTMYKDLIHSGNVEHRDLHNMFGQWVHQGTVNGLIRRSGNTMRPFVLSRAFFAGSQKYGAIWTGDNAAQWSHLSASIPMLLSLGVAGIPFVGADVGGFFGDPDAELLTRWYQIGAYQPFFREHAHLDTKRREPYLFAEPHLSIMRNAIRARYAMLPYWYTLFYQTSLTGIPPMRPLWMEYPDDSKTWNLETQFLVGENILVCPVLEQGQTSVYAYIPGVQPWYDLESYNPVLPGHRTLQAPLEKIPVLLRGGSILPRKERSRRSSTQMVHDPYTLIIALDTNQKASGELYIDDGETFAFQKGAFLYLDFTYEDKKLMSRLNPSSGNFYSTNQIEKIVLLGLPTQNVVAFKREKDGEKVAFETISDTTGVVVVRAPALKISDEWTIEFKY